MVNKMILLSVIFITVRFVFASDSFSATAELEDLLNLERDVIDKMINLRKLLDGVVTGIGNYQKEYVPVRDLLTSGKITPADYIGNPINAFHLMRRIVVHFEDVRKALNSFDLEAVSNLKSDILGYAHELPTATDLSGAATSIAVLQSTYRLNITEFLRGQIQLRGRESHQSEHSLNARDCLFIGKHAFNKGLYDRAVDWLQSCIHLSDEEKERTTSRADIEPFLRTAIKIHDEVLSKKGPIGKDWRTAPVPFKAKLEGKARKQKAKTRDEIEDRIATNIDPSVLRDHEELEIFHRLCRGDQIRSTFELKDLRCRYLRHHPSFLIGPIRLEEQWKDPYIVVFRNFMTDREMSLMKTEAIKRLERSAHGGRYGTYVTSDKRTSKQAWVHSNDSVIKKLTDRIGWTVGLDPYPENFGSEIFQVANYGIGGRYTPHTDHDAISNLGDNPSDLSNDRGDRIATFMAYLEDVPEGGATVFTIAGITIWPEKGSAAFWWNLKANGEGDLRTKHGACPVLRGSKWICNKWFHERQQAFTRPCGKNLEMSIKYP